MSWRKQQLQEYYQGNGIIEQDAQLINFVKNHNIKQFCLVGENDMEYFQERLPDVHIRNQFDHTDDMLAFFQNNVEFTFETFVSRINMIVKILKPKYLYIAINKYLVKTNRTWPNLTDNYDEDLLNILTDTIAIHGYQELDRSYKEDRGRYFNFVHPTTNVYYERIDS